MEGWLKTVDARGSFVVDVGAVPRGTVARSASYPLGDPPPASRPAPLAELDLAGRLPDERLLPVKALARAYRRALLARGQQWLA